MTDLEINELIASISKMARRVGGVFIVNQKKLATFRAATKREHDESIRGKSVEFVLGRFA